MAGTLVVGTIGNGVASKSVDSLMGSQLAARVAFNGQNTVSIYESNNVSSITDLGNGYYQANFSKPMPTPYYTMVGTAQRTGGYSDIVVSIKSGDSVQQSTSKVPFITCDTEGTVIDPILVSLAFFS